MQFLKKIKHQLTQIRPNKTQTLQVDSLTGYAHWARHYPAQAHNPLMEIEQQAMLNLLPDVSGKVCLDLACGSGRYLRLLRERRAEQVVGLDYSPDMLRQANNPKSKIQNPKLIRSPFIELPFAGGIFDIITCGLGVGHEPNLERALTEAGRVLRPGGSIIYSDFHPFGALAGWQRSFSVNGQVFALEYYVHLYSDHLQACQAAGLSIDAVLEPVAGAYAPPGFGKMPVVLVIRAVKASNQ